MPLRLLDLARRLLRRPTPPRRRSAPARLRLESLENRDNPAQVTWVGLDGGSWAVGANWSTGTVPAADPGDELSLLPYLGGWGGLRLWSGANVTGTLTTAAGSETVAAMGDLRLTGAGTLAGGGWVSVAGVGAELSFDGQPATVSRLYAGAYSVVEGTADITVTSALIAQATTITGPAGSLLTNQGYMHIAAPIPGMTVDGRGLVIAAGKTGTMNGDVSLGDGAVYDNRGTVKVTGNSTIRSGVGGGKVQNAGEWVVDTTLFRAEVPFTNTGKLAADRVAKGAPRVVELTDFTQPVAGVEAPVVSLDHGGELRVGKAQISAGQILAADPVAPQLLQGLVRVDSALATTGNGELRLTPPDEGSVGLNNLILVADEDSQVVLDAVVPEGVLLISDSALELDGKTRWVDGEIRAAGVRIENNGDFTIEGGKTFEAPVASFDNYGIFEQLTGAPGKVQTTVSTKFVNHPGAIVSAGGELQFDCSKDSSFAGNLNLLAGARVRIDYTLNDAITFSAAANVGSGGDVGFYMGKTNVKLGASFTGDGTVSVRGAAIWQLDPGIAVEVNKLVVGPNDSTGLGFGTIEGLRDLTRFDGGPLSQIRIGTNVHLTSFILQTLLLTVPPTATGQLSPIGDPVANTRELFITARLWIEGVITWSGNNVILRGASQIWVGGGTEEAPARFNILTAARMVKGANADPEITVAQGGRLGRIFFLPYLPTVFEMPIVDAGGEIDWTGIEIDP